MAPLSSHHCIGSVIHTKYGRENGSIRQYIPYILESFLLLELLSVVVFAVLLLQIEYFVTIVSSNISYFDVLCIF